MTILFICWLIGIWLLGITKSQSDRLAVLVWMITILLVGSLVLEALS